MAEVYSPLRVCATARRLGLKAGFSFDLTVNDENGEPWDLSIESVQRKALRKWEKEKPWLLVASPPCTMISLLQNLSLAKRDDAVVRMEVERAIKHLAFAVFLCKKQAAEGRKFALEHRLQRHLGSSP